MTDLDVGKYLLCLDFIGTGFSPAIRIVLPPDTDAEQLAAAISADLQAVLRKHLGDFEAVLDQKIGVRVHGGSGIIQTPEERRRAFESMLQDIRGMDEERATSQAAYDAMVDGHPMNGKLGWWLIRHRCLAKASSYREALQKASGEVDPWECPEAEWIGEELPDVIAC